MNPTSAASVGSVASDAPTEPLSEVIDATRSWFQRFIIPMRDDDLDTLALWTIHTWLTPETYTSPRLLIDSPMPGSGKTTTLEHLGKLCLRPVQMASVTSPAIISRMLNIEVRTILIDEVDRTLDPKKPGIGDLIAILNSGYKVGGVRPVLVPLKGGGWDPQEHSTFSPVALAGNTPHLPDDTRSRCIVVRLMPDNQNRAEHSDWEWIEDDALALAERIKNATEAVRDQVKQARPELPPGCHSRHRERWNPLAKIASVAGGYWADKIQDLITRDLALAAEAAENGESSKSPGIQLAHDLFEIFGDAPRFESSNDLVRLLIRLNPESWSMASPMGKDLTPKRLGSILNRSFGIYSQRIGANTRGWHSNQFRQIWQNQGLVPSPGTVVSDPTNPTKATQTTDDGTLL